MAEFKLPKNSEIIEGQKHPIPNTNGDAKTRIPGAIISFNAASVEMETQRL